MLLTFGKTFIYNCLFKVVGLNMKCLLAFLIATSSVFAFSGYVANQGGHTVDKIDTVSLSVTGAVTGATFQTPDAVAISPDGKTAYVPDQDAAALFVIDIASSMVTESVPLPNPREVAVSPDGKTVYVTDQGGIPSVYAIDTTLLIPVAITNGLTPFLDPLGVAFSPDGTLAYVADAGSQEVYVIDTSSHTVTHTVIDNLPYPAFANPVGVVFSHDGTLAYVTDFASSTLYKIDVATHSVNGDINGAPFTSPFGIAITPDGKSLYVTDTGGTPSVIVVDTNSFTASSLPPPATPLLTPVAVAMTPDGSQAFVTDAGNGIVYRIDTSSNMFDGTITGFSSPTGIGLFAAMGSPQNLTGKQKKNDFGTVYELFNQLNWEASSSATTVGYFVYRDGTKIAILNAATLEYQDHNRKKGVVTLYAVTAFDAGGSESALVSITIK
jgi:YVTN family beta-propeller protein